MPRWYAMRTSGGAVREPQMTAREGNLVGLSLIAALFIAAMAGIALLAIADKMPAHTDERRAVDLTNQYLDFNPQLPSVEREALRPEIIRLRTSKWRVYNIGLAITLVAPLLLLAAVRFKLWDIQRLREISTPRTRLRLLVIAGMAWLGLLPAILFDISDAYAKDDITPTVDTGHGIFLVAGPPFFLITLVIIAAFGRYVVLRNARFPACLWIWDKAQGRRSLIWTTFYGLSGSMLFAMAIRAAWDSPWFLPSLMIGLYVIASTRAAILNGSIASGG